MAFPPYQPSFGGAFDRRPELRLLFVLQPDGPAIRCVTRLLERLRHDGIVRGRTVETHRLHITLHHLGDFVDQIPPSLLPSAEAAAATVKMPPFEVAFDRIVGTGRSLLLRPSDGSPALKAFRNTFSTALIKAGLRKRVNLTFNPHMTLSYDRHDLTEQAVAPVTWTARQFRLIKSGLGEHQHIEHDCWPIQG